jgi:hypothetical protein
MLVVVSSCTLHSIALVCDIACPPNHGVWVGFGVGKGVRLSQLVSPCSSQVAPCRVAPMLVAVSPCTLHSIALVCDIACPPNHGVWVDFGVGKGVCLSQPVSPCSSQVAPCRVAPMLVDVAPCTLHSIALVCDIACPPNHGVWVVFGVGNGFVCLNLCPHVPIRWPHAGWHPCWLLCHHAPCNMCVCMYVCVCVCPSALMCVFACVVVY